MTAKNSVTILGKVQYSSVSQIAFNPTYNLVVIEGAYNRQDDQYVNRTSTLNSVVSPCDRRT